MTDGGNSGGNPLEVIRDENQALQNRVLINTYGLGTRKCMNLKLKLTNSVTVALTH